MRTFVISFLASCVCGAAVAASAPTGAVYRCWNPVTHRTEIAQQQFSHCDGEQTVRTPGGVVTKVGEADPVSVEDPVVRVLRIRQAVLLSHFPDEASHRKARDSALRPVMDDIRRIELRVKDLEAERPALIEETQFYIGKSLPPELRRKIDANDAKMAALKQALSARADEVIRINVAYDKELTELKRLWAPATGR